VVKAPELRPSILIVEPEVQLELSPVITLVTSAIVSGVPTEESTSA
jgi:hypothetical protein